MNEPTVSRRNDLLAIALLLAIATAFFGDMIFAGREPYLRDLTRYYYPTKRIIREVILGGSFPFWNPYYSAGQPMAANPEYEVFYPLQWLILLPSYDLGYRLHIIANVFVGLAGMYLLLRSMRLRLPAAFFGAFTFGLGGLFLSFVNLLPILFCAAWIPLLLMFARRMLISFRWRDFALGSLCGGMQLLAAEPVTLMQTWFLVGCYALYRTWYGRSRIRVLLRSSALVLLLIAGSLSVGAVQLFPALDHVEDSIRSRPFDLDLVTSWSMPVARPLELIYPNLFGHITKNGAMWYWSGGMYRNVGSPFVFNYYLGLFAIALVLGSALVRPRGGRLVLAVVAVSLLLALGEHTPLFRWMYEAGLTRSIRYPEKFALIGLFALIVYASTLFDRLPRDRRLARSASGVVLGITAFAAVAAVFSFTPWYPEVFAKLWGIGKSPNMATIVSMTRTDWIVAVVRGAALLGLLWGLRKGLPPRLWGAAVVVFLAADLLPIGREVNPTMPARFARPPEAVASLAPDKSEYRIFHEVDWYGRDNPARKYFSTGASVYWMVRNGIFPMTPATWGFRTVLERDYDKTALLPTVDLVDAMWEVSRSGRKDWAETFMSMSNAEYRAKFRSFEAEKKRVRNLDDARPIDFVRGARPPRFWFADSLVQARDRKEFARKLSAQSWSRRAAFVAFEPFTPSKGTIERAAETPNSVRLRVRAEGKSFLYFSITPHKYWRATVDGHPAALHVANVGYQGLVIPGGSHDVRLVYRNDVVVVSGAVSATSAVLLLLIAFRSRTPWRDLTVTEPAEAATAALVPRFLPAGEGDEVDEVDPMGGGEES